MGYGKISRPVEDMYLLCIHNNKITYKAAVTSALQAVNIQNSWFKSLLVTINVQTPWFQPKQKPEVLDSNSSHNTARIVNHTV